MELRDNEIEAEWNRIFLSLDSSEETKHKLISFIDKCGDNSVLAEQYKAKAKNVFDDLFGRAISDWIEAKTENTVFGYMRFIENYKGTNYRAESVYCTEARDSIRKMKSKLLAEMKRFPMYFSRERMYELISSGMITFEDLVVNNSILTEKAHLRIKEYPVISSEQRRLPLNCENIFSPNGNIDILPFGVSGSGGKTSLLAAVSALSGMNGFSIDGSEYALDMIRYMKDSCVPTATDTGYLNIIKGHLRINDTYVSNLSLVEFAGEKVTLMAGFSKNRSWEELGSDLYRVLSNANNKILLFAVDVTNGHHIYMEGDGDIGKGISCYESDILECLCRVIGNNKQFCRKIIGVHIILTKVDLLETTDCQESMLGIINDNGYMDFYKDLCSFCRQYEIMRYNNYKPDVIPFSIGKFMPGDTYKFDDKYAIKLLDRLKRDISFYREQNKGLNRLRAMMGLKHD